MLKHQYDTTLLRAVIGLCTGVAMVATIRPILILAGHGDRPIGSLLAPAAAGYLSALLVLMAMSLLTVVPIWAGLHLLNRRSCRYAAMLGALTGFVTMCGFTGWTAMHTPRPFSNGQPNFNSPARELTGDDWFAMITGSIPLTLVSWVPAVFIWRIAYRRSLNTSAGEVSSQPSPPPLS